ncbi:MAG TPA: sugar ABC transporter permease, partial [Candidatus Acetothermia bacterium]|nr:sugar ABC transporter permease [Candidatus Acetothermia bacterium]
MRELNRAERKWIRIPDAWRSGLFWRETAAAYAYLLPSMVILGVFVFYPFFSAFRLSLFRWSSLNPPGNWVGLQHYRYLFGNRAFIKSLWTTFYYVGVSVPLTLILALVIASILDKALRFLSFFRVSYFLPYISPVVALVMV